MKKTAQIKKSGFTLVELIVVISIIAILAVVVAIIINPFEIGFISRACKLRLFVYWITGLFIFH